MARKPLTVNAGQLEQLASGTPLDVGGWNLPIEGGTLGYVLEADASGNAIWSTDLTVTTLTSTNAAKYEDGTGTAYHGLFTEDRSGSVTGTCVIDLPTGGFEDSMLAIRITGYNYSSAGGWSVLIGGYTYDTTDDIWLNNSASIQGNPPFTSIRLGYNGNTGKACIMLGTTGSGWNYPVVHVAEMVVGFSGEDLYQSGWAIEWYTDETNFSSQAGYADPVTVDINRDFPSPTVDDQVLISTANGIADWQTAGNDQYLASDGSGEVAWVDKPAAMTGPASDNQILISSAVGVASWVSPGGPEELLITDALGDIIWESKPFGFNIPAPSSDGQVFQADSPGVGSWSTVLDGLSFLTVDNITIDGATIISDSGAIGFGAANLSTTGWISATNIPLPGSGTDQVLISTGLNTAEWQHAGNNEVLTSDGAGEVSWSSQPSSMTEPTADDQLLVATGSGTASWTDTLDILRVDNLTLDGAVITSDTDAISFADNSLTTSGLVSTGNINSRRITAWREIGSGPTDATGIFTANVASGGGPVKILRIIHEERTGPGNLVNGSGPAVDFFIKDEADSDPENYIARIAAVRREDDDTSGSLDFYTRTFGGVSYCGRFEPDGSLTLLNGLNVTGGPITSSNLPSPTVDDQVLISTAADTAAWSTAGNDQYLASNGSGVVAWANIPSGFSDPTADNQLLASTGVGSSTWTDTIDILKVDNLTLDGAIITSDTGAISFSDENLSTSGTVIGSNIPSPTIDDQVLVSTAAGAASWSTANNNQYLGSDGSGEVAWSNKSDFDETDTLDTVSDRGATTNQTLTVGGITTTGTVSAGQLTVDNLTLDGATITSDTGAISFDDENLSTTGTVTGSNIPSPTADNQLLAATGADAASWTDTLDILKVDDITLNGATIASDTGAISFSNENLTTTGWLSAASIINTAGSGAQYYDGILSSGTTSSTKVGTCVIDLPVDFVDTMLAIKIRGYDYTSDEGPWEVLVGGYLYDTVSDIWVNHRASVQGEVPFKDIRLGYNGNTGKACIMLGLTGLTWNYPQVQILDMLAGYQNRDLYKTGWAITWYTDETNFTGQAGFADPVTVSWNRDYPAPSTGNQILLSSESKVADWQTAGNDKVLGSDGSGDVTWSNKSALLTDTLDTVADRGATTNQTLTVGGITTTGTVSAGNLQVDNININGAVISSNTGAISFSNENLTTTGKMMVGGSDTVYTHSTFEIEHEYAADKYTSGLHIRSTNDNYGLFLGSWKTGNAIISSGSHYSAAWDFLARATEASALVMDNANGIKFFFNTGLTPGSNYFATVRATIDATGLDVVGTVDCDNLQVDNININGAVISSNTGAISFSNENVTTTGTMVGSNIPSPSADDQVLISTASGVATWNSPSGDQYLATNPDGDAGWYDKVWTSTLSSDMTIYVRTTGNDSTGDGTLGAPYLTIMKVIQVIGKMYIGSYNVLVDIGEGVFAEGGTLAFIHPFGQQVTFQGVSESIDSRTVSVYGSQNDYGHSGLYFQNFEVILPAGKSVSVGDYIGISSATGGVNPKALVGLHRVVIWTGGTLTATLRRVFNNGSEAPSGTVTVDIDLIKTVIAFTEKNGIKVTGPYSAGVWRGLVIQGDYDDENNADYGVWALNGAVVSIGGSPASGDACGVHGFKTAVYAQNNGLIFADYGYMAVGGQHLCSAQNGGILGLRSACLNGTKNSGIYAFNNSSVAASNVNIVGTGDNSVFAYQGSFVDISSAFIGESDSTTSIKADHWACVDATGSTKDDAVSPVIDGDNDGSYIIGH